MKRLILTAALLLAACSPVANNPGQAQSATRPPAPAGAVPADMLNSSVTPQTIHSTICVTGWTKTIRPPTSYTEPLKLHQIATYRYADRNPADFEEDHMVPLVLAGNPTAHSNLWPEPHQFSTPDDSLEVALSKQVCSGRMTLAAAQAQIFGTKVAHGYRRDASVAP